MPKDTVEEEKGKGRRERVPFSANRKKLDVVYVDPEFHKKWHPHWFNDERGRIELAKRAGYVFVHPDEIVGGDTSTTARGRVTRIATGRVDGNPEVKCHLMKLDLDLYKQDQAMKEERNALVDRTVRSGNAGGADVENKYGEVRLS